MVTFITIITIFVLIAFFIYYYDKAYPISPVIKELGDLIKKDYKGDDSFKYKNIEVRIESNKYNEGSGVFINGDRFDLNFNEDRYLYHILLEITNKRREQVHQ